MPSRKFPFGGGLPEKTPDISKIKVKSEVIDDFNEADEEDTTAVVNLQPQVSLKEVVQAVPEKASPIKVEKAKKRKAKAQVDVVEAKVLVPEIKAAKAGAPKKPKWKGWVIVEEETVKEDPVEVEVEEDAVQEADVEVVSGVNTRLKRQRRK
ncbi:uncharacterized protein MELLADRAFT_92003 [Melampsora larici-populina 98AG31]|uniref:Uncharacterized protein n=1 Tax=Melampsora larici-populina (strain 98AG31 / pathotype 3-4-7) TaxID=747676 RepID=F4S165_MELLP|nr:uncharacterized protein MELLADRAFT_92003 [Melampsora larici-populina 98AG31]EGG01619.1 hypothetical protein MELLADRAFT_92003 [Melampsora larici-populina 98AG31]